MSKSIREVAGIFKDSNALQDAIDELSISGFERYELSVIGSEKAMKDKFSVAFKNPKSLIDNPKTPRGVNIATEEMGVAEGAVVSGGVLIGVVASLIAAGGVAVHSVIPAAVIGATAGTAFGGVMAQLIGNAHAERLQKQIDKGGLILWVRVDNKTKEKLAYDILQGHDAKYVHVHDIKLV